MSKKEKKNKEMKEERDRLHEDVDLLNDEILKKSWTKDVQTRKLHDRKSPKPQNPMKFIIFFEYASTCWIRSSACMLGVILFESALQVLYNNSKN